MCPIDNTELTATDVFADACIEREVLELEVRCPGNTHGCKRVVSLRNLQPHIQACNYQVILLFIFALMETIDLDRLHRSATIFSVRSNVTIIGFI